jgi:hypothetical protein
MRTKNTRQFYRVLFISTLFLLLCLFSIPFNNKWYRQEDLLTEASPQTFDTEEMASTVTLDEPEPDPIILSEADFSSEDPNITLQAAKFLDFPKLSTPPPTPKYDRNPYLPLPQRITVSHIEGDNCKKYYATNYTSVELLLGGEYVPGKFLPLFDFRGDRFDDITYAASAGFVGRFIPDRASNFCRILGFNVFYDYRQGNLGYYNQVGLGLEILGSRWDFRANGYLPFGKKRKMEKCVFDDYIGPYFAIEDLFEGVSYSFDAEVGWLAVNSQYILLYVAGGPYYISGKTCDETTRGGQFRIQPQYKDYIALDCRISYDPLFHTVYQTEVIVNLPLYLLSKKIDKRETCGLTPRQIYQPVEKFEVMPLGRCCCWTSNF